MDEQWKTIPGWERYEASNVGRVRSWQNTRGNLAAEPRIKTPFYRGGRPYISMSMGNRRGTKQVGHLVLLAFAGKPAPGLEASHVDGNAANNHVENLAWETHVQNMARKIDHGTILRGEAHQNSKLTERDAELIRRMIDVKVPGAVIAHVFDVSASRISQIRTGGAWPAKAG